MKHANPQAEFILVSTMLPNPETVLFGLQTAYRDLLREMAGTGVAVADITGAKRASFPPGPTKARTA